MSAKKDEKVNNSAGSSTGNTIDYKNYNSTGWGGPQDYSKYGIDYSQEQRDAIAQIFKDQATAAYNTARNDFSNTMATQQASLADTLRRSQSQAVATGASRGMQAANELSAMLGLQQTAAQEASKMQGTYAEALANAQRNAYDVQNAANQVAMQGYVADSASNAQMYVANMEDPYRALSVAAELDASGQTEQAKVLKEAFYRQHGYSAEEAAAAVAQSNLDSAPALDSKGNQITGKTMWTPGGDGVLDGKLDTGFGGVAANLDDLKDGEDEEFRFKYYGTWYDMKATGPVINATSDPALYNALTKMSGASEPSGQLVRYGNKTYVSAKGVWREITGGFNPFSGNRSYYTFEAGLKAQAVPKSKQETK